MTWDKVYSLEDYKFIAVYHVRDDIQWKQFEKNMLKNHNLFEECIELEDGDVAYVFDCSSLKDDYDKVAQGKYSKLSATHKAIVSKFFNSNGFRSSLILSYLIPEKYYKIYARLLNVKIHLLKQVGELCNAPNLTEEMLAIKKKVTTFDTVSNV